MRKVNAVWAAAAAIGMCVPGSVMADDGRALRGSFFDNLQGALPLRVERTPEATSTWETTVSREYGTIQTGSIGPDGVGVLRSSLLPPDYEHADLRGSVEFAIEVDPRTLAAEHDTNAARAEVWRELLRFAPTVTGSYEKNSRYPDGSGLGGLSENSSEAYAAVSLNLPLFTGGQRYYGYKSALAQEDAAHHRAKSARDTVALQTVESWVQAEVSFEEASIVRAGIGRFKCLRKAILAREDAGFASDADLAHVDADIARTRRELAAIRAQAEKAHARNTQLTGTDLMAGGSLRVLEQHIAGDKSVLIDQARAHSPDIKAARASYDAALYNSRSAFGRHLPQVNLTGEYRHYTDRALFSSAEDGFSVGLRVDVPLADLSTVADTVAQSERREAALYREAETRRSVERVIDELWADYQAAGSMRKQAKREVFARRESAAAIKARYARGFGTLDQAIDAEVRLRESERAALQVEAQRAMLAARLLVVSGQFDPSQLSP